MLAVPLKSVCNVVVEVGQFQATYIPATVVDQIEKTTEEPEGFCIFVTKQLLYHE